MSRPHPATEAEAVESLKYLALWQASGLILQKADRDDVLQEMAIASIKAYRRYDPSKGSLSNYAIWWHRHTVNKILRERRLAPKMKTSEYLEEHRAKEPPDPDLLEFLESAISELTPVYQRVVRLWYGIGCKAVPHSEEGAGILGMKPESYATMRYQAVTQLRKIVAKKLGEESPC